MGEYEDYLAHNSKFGDRASADTPVMSENWCPVCEPDRDPSVEILQVLYCSKHPNPGTPGQDGGEADSQVASGTYLSGSATAGGFDNRQASEVIHRGRSLDVPPSPPQTAQDTADVYMGDGDCG